MERERLEQCIERALGRTQFRNVWRQHFGAGAMHELYARKRHHEYCLNGANSVAVREDELADLVSAIVPMLAPYRASDSGAVGNGLYRLTGALASPRLPSVEDYARILVLAAARTGPGRSAATFCGWVEGQPIPVWQCFLLKGVLNDGRISPRDGLVLETLLGNGEEFPRSLYVQLDAGDSGNSPEIQFRIATRGAWLARDDTYDERKTCFDTLRKCVAGDRETRLKFSFVSRQGGHGFSGTLMTSAKPASIPSGRRMDWHRASCMAGASRGKTGRRMPARSVEPRSSAGRHYCAW